GDSKLEGLELDDNFFTKLRDENITGDVFLRLTGWDLKEYGMTLRQALKLEDYIKGLYNREGALGVYLHALEEHEARFTKLEQRDKEKTNLIAKMDDDIKEIKQSSANASSVKNPNNVVRLGKLEKMAKPSNTSD
ncbi:8631_t:CDS:2, partial [Funneliformis geosporum]